MMNNTNQMPGGMNKSPAKGELIPPVPGKAKPSWTTVPKGPPSPTTDKALGDKWGVSDQPEGMKTRSQKRSALGLGTSKVVRSSGHVSRTTSTDSRTTTPKARGSINSLGLDRLGNTSGDKKDGTLRGPVNSHDKEDWNRIRSQVTTSEDR